MFKIHIMEAEGGEEKKDIHYVLKIIHFSWGQWLTPVILATQEAEIRRITVQSQPGQIV
jgi:hypothetical protein